MNDPLHSRFARTESASSPAYPAAGEGIVTISLPSLLALASAAEAISLRPVRVRSMRHGPHSAMVKGRGMEFDEVRPYQAGDDLRTIDWRVTARSGRPHTKLYREERERPLLLLVDLRPSMDFASCGAFKSVRVRQFAAIVGWAALQQGDRIGGLIFDHQGHDELPPRRGQRSLLALLEQMVDGSQRQQLGDESDLLTALQRLQRVAQPGSQLVIFSDCHDLHGDARALLAQMARHHTIILAAIHDPMEAALPAVAHLPIFAAGQQHWLRSASLSEREAYHQRFKQHWQGLADLCHHYHLHWLPIVTSDDPADRLRREWGRRP
jgi:uncharacterized protein (DUF58 family)